MDEDKRLRFEELKQIFTNKKDDNYIELEYKDNKYYIEITHQDDSEGIRWFHRNKWSFELVHTTEEGHKNIAPFCLFSSFEDCILNAMLCEDNLKYKIDLKNKKLA